MAAALSFDFLALLPLLLFASGTADARLLPHIWHSNTIIALSFPFLCLLTWELIPQTATVPQALQTLRSTLSGRLIPFSDEMCSKRAARCADTEGEVVARRCDAAQRWRSCRAEVVGLEVMAGRRCGDWVVT